MAHLKYLYFAKRARLAGAIDIAEIFEQNAAAEAQQAFAHLDLMYPRTRKSTRHSPNIGVETKIESKIIQKKQNYAGIFPNVKNIAEEIGNHTDVLGFEVRLEESKQQACDFKRFVESNAPRAARGSLV